jgi:RimJ/RimL family protein N-acetyltransferase
VVAEHWGASVDGGPWNIVGEKIAVGPVLRTHLPHYLLWTNDFRTQRTQGSGLPTPDPPDNIEAWYDSFVRGRNDVAFFTIYERSSGRPIGWTGLEEIDFHHRRATFVVQIGVEECRGKGYGSEAARMMLDYGFTALGLHNINLWYYEFNIAGRRAYERAGFREYGRRTQSHFMGGRLWDTVYMECLSTEFTGGPLAEIFAPDEDHRTP